MNYISKKSLPILMVVFGGFFLPRIVEGFGVNIEDYKTLDYTLRIVSIAMIIIGLALLIKYLKEEK